MKRNCMALLLMLAALTATAANDAPSRSVSDASAHYFAGLALVDQHGSKVDLYEDLMRGKIVIINSFFATCHGSCPVMISTFKKIEDAFQGDDRVSLISITVDPANDTPAKLDEYAKNVNARKEWHFLTGTPQQVQAALGKLGLAVDVRDNHSNIVLVGNLNTGLWKKILGIAESVKVIDAVRSVVEDR
jgi:protein SCO1/2